jgi:hypothetical protein
MRRFTAGFVVTICSAGLIMAPPMAAQAPPPSIMLGHTTSKEVAKAMGEVLKEQKFKVTKASKGRIVLTQKRGNVAQATGEVMKVRLEMGFAVEDVGDSLKVTVTDETYYADRGPLGEQQRSVEIDKEHDKFMNLFQAVKARLDSTAAPADSAGG